MVKTKANKISSRGVATVKISDRVAVNISLFNGVLWYHLKDLYKSKTMSVSEKDLKTLISRKEELLEAGKKVKKHSSSLKAKKKNHAKKDVEIEESESDEEMCSQSDDTDSDD